MPTWICKDWVAWHDRMPGKEPTLYVLGSCELPTPLYTPVLTPRDPPGPVEEDYQLDLTARPPADFVIQLPWWTEVRHTGPTSSHYETVSIFDAETGESIASGIPIQEVSRSD
jgi:hypothetical protein